MRIQCLCSSTKSSFLQLGYYLLVGVRGGKGGSRSFFVPKLQRGSGLFTMLTILIAKQVQLSISRHRAHWSISNYALCGWRGLTGRKKERHARRPRTGRSHPSLGLSVFSLSFFTGRSTTSLLRYIGCYFSLKLSCLYKHDHPVGGGGKGSRSHGSRVVFWMLCSRTAQFYGPDPTCSGARNSAGLSAETNGFAPLLICHA